METGRVFLGRYEAKKLLGEGGMGRVYLAHQYDLKRQVVVKVMHDHIAADPRFRKQFEDETYLLAQFQHPFAVTLYDATLNDPEGPCIVMEYIRGITLEQLLEQNGGRLSPARMGRLLGQMCEVLQAAHQQGIIHRDLKPANVMVVDADTPYEKVKVMDFGLAKLRRSSSIRQVADGDEPEEEFAVGTPAYICPEQVRGEKMDHRGDLYSIGVMLYEALTGRLPFLGDEALDVLLAHAADPPPPFREIGVDWISAGVESVVMACLAKEPAQRPASARDLAERYAGALARGVDVGTLQQSPSKPDTPPVPVFMPAAAPTPAKPVDPNSLVQQFEAWMPESIAVHKLKGFVTDAGGDVLEAKPGLVLVRLGNSGPYMRREGPLAWLGLGRNSGLVDMELAMDEADPNRKGLLNITVTMRSHKGSANDPMWRAHCKRIFVDLRAYLMGSGQNDQ